MVSTKKTTCKRIVLNCWKQGKKIFFTNQTYFFTEKKSFDEHFPELIRSRAWPRAIPCHVNSVAWPLNRRHLRWYFATGSLRPASWAFLHNNHPAAACKNSGRMIVIYSQIFLRISVFEIWCHKSQRSVFKKRIGKRSKKE